MSANRELTEVLSLLPTSSDRTEQLVAMTEPEVKRITVTQRASGYAHDRLWGTCSPDVTVKDIQTRFYHAYFGGREAWVSNGEWGCVIHTD